MHPAFKSRTTASDKRIVQDGQPSSTDRQKDTNVVAFFGNRGHWGYYDFNEWDTWMKQESEHFARAA